MTTPAISTLTKSAKFCKLCLAVLVLAHSRHQLGRFDNKNQNHFARIVIEQIREKILQQQYEYSRHAVDQGIIRHISDQEMLEAIVDGEIIEDYPNDKYGPSCLIAGQTSNGRWIHVQSSYPSRPNIKIITLYQPDPNEWIDFKVRKSK